MKDLYEQFGGKGCVLVYGNFNVIHPGHLRLLRFAKDCGNTLVVGVNSDAKAGKAALVSELDRLEGVLANTYVDHGFILTTSPEEAIRKLEPEVVVKGKEHEAGSNPETQVLDQYGGKLLFCSGEAHLTSADLLAGELAQGSQRVPPVGENYRNRHEIDIADLSSLITDFTDKNVCVVGDLIVDEYVACEPEGMSREEPVMVVAPSTKKRFIGGGGIVAAHAAGLGAQVSYYGVRGEDEVGRFAESEMINIGIHCVIRPDPSRPSTQKRRYRVENKSLLRVNRFRKHPISKELQNELLADLRHQLAMADLLVLADFNYGMLPDEFVTELISMAKGQGVFIAADSQCSSQLGNVGRFKGADLLTPTEHEARVSLQDQDSGLVVLAEKLRQKASAKHVLLTLNQEGVLVHAGSDDPWVTDRLPAFCANPVDASGAGDCLMITTALALCSGSTVWQAAYTGSVAARVQVSRLGNRPIAQAELLAAVELHQ
ncbi:MAG: PfkB family carbohydrate kinase [Limisphaerales bacterium]